MKKLLSIFLISSVVTAYGQKISDFQYIYVPKTFEKEMNKYDLNKQLVKGLESKNYKVIQEEKEDWPAELSQNRCSVARANLLDNSSMFRNRVIVKFSDCNDKVLLESKGMSMQKEFETGFPDALEISLRSVPLSNPSQTISIVENAKKPKEEVVAKVEKVKTTETASAPVVTISEVSSSPIATTNKAEVFSNGKISVQKINMGSGQFILASGSSSSPYAVFTETSKQGVYRVKMENGATALGYAENGSLIIEIPQANDTYQKEVFQKK